MGQADLKQAWGNFLGDGNVLHLDHVVVTKAYTLVKTHRAVCLKWLHFIVCKLYLNILEFSKLEKRRACSFFPNKVTDVVQNYLLKLGFEVNATLYSLRTLSLESSLTLAFWSPAACLPHAALTGITLLNSHQNPTAQVYNHHCFTRMETNLSKKVSNLPKLTKMGSELHSLSLCRTASLDFPYVHVHTST